MKNSKSLGAELLEFVKSTPTCLHEADFFESKGIDFEEYIGSHVEDEEFMRLLARARHTIGRRVLEQAILKGRSSPLVGNYLRFRMYDYNEFIEESARREWKDRQAAQMASADESIDRLANFMSTL